MKTFIIIPAYNEQKSVGKVIDQVRKEGFKHIIVVDDGSTDKTLDVLIKKKVTLVKHEVNKGLGSALKSGLELARKLNADKVITMDADGQHSPKDLIGFDKMLDYYEVVIGTRMLDKKGMPFIRVIGNTILNYFTLFLYGVWCTDTQSGMRGFNKSAIEQINIPESKMEVSSIFFQQIYTHRLSFIEVPIKTIYTKYSKSKGQSSINAFRIIKDMFKYRLQMAKMGVRYE